MSAHQAVYPVATMCHSIPLLGNAQQPKTETYLLTLRLSPAFADYLGRPGVIDEVDASRRERRLPSVEKLESLGLPEIFSRAFIERLGYLRGLHDKRIMWAAGPFPGLKDAAYVFTAADEHEARRVIEEDLLYRTGFIEPDFVLRRWLARCNEVER